MITNEAVQILLVDDRLENLVAMEAILEPLGYPILEARSGFEALKLLLMQPVSLIILDVRMPEMDGFETARRIRQRDRTRYIPILFVTAHPVDEYDLLQAHMAGGTDYIQQPLRPEVLSKKVRLILEQTRKFENKPLAPLSSSPLKLGQGRIA